MKVFADEYFRDGVLSSGGKDTSSCNHDMDLVIGKAFVLC